MSTEDILLRVGRLEIESSKAIKNPKEDNPFLILLQKRNFSVKVFSQNNKCACHNQKKKYITICKKKHNKILKEPVLKLSQCYYKNKKGECQELARHSRACPVPSLNNENLNLHSLVDTCNQLRISNRNNENKYKHTHKNDSMLRMSEANRDSPLERNTSSSCSQQALNPPCDVTIDELASYFETLVHIPKKMSSMAEMMYI